jgi:hypothetical protein
MSDSFIGAGVANHANPRNLTASKKPISVFDLTIWAYRIQMVQYEVDRHAEFLPGRNDRNWIDDLLGVRRGYDGRGCINGAGTSAALAAHVVHAHVRQRSSIAQRLIVKAGSTAIPPNWNPIVPGFRIVPSRKAGGGEIRMIWNKHRHAIGCLIEYQGTPPAIADAIRDEARGHYLTWWEGLASLKSAFRVDPRLACFEVSGIGALREPWKIGA